MFNLFIFYLFFICDISIGKSMSTIDQNPVSNTLQECQRCKVLTDSFNHWLDKTSRGKYEGGDAAWEETKLKSYSRSEVRLVEVQEGLCSELIRHQDSCYSLAEEVETVLENWWFNEDPYSVDLYTWLCIETLQYCCPKKHFGALCSPCPLDNNNLICGGHGQCEGDGTRKGNGTCLCNKGYAGSYCEECAKNFYGTNSNCKPCHKACVECSDEGPSACKACAMGWHMESGICTDVNECLDLSVCKENQYCVNEKGSYSCKMCHTSCKSCKGGELTDCTLCDSRSVLWSGTCVDDELKSHILRNTLKRVALYSGLLLMAFFIFRNSKTLASLVILIIAVYIYFGEKSSNIHIVEVFLNLYLN